MYYVLWGISIWHGFCITSLLVIQIHGELHNEFNKQNARRIY
jgi:hypothetical protein